MQRIEVINTIVHLKQVFGAVWSGKVTEWYEFFGDVFILINFTHLNSIRNSNHLFFRVMSERLDV